MRWIRKHIPTRDTIHENRLLRPFARHLSDPALWRMTRRSVPRAVALGLGVGVLIPFMHTAIAAVLAIPMRANVAIAAALTLLVNPQAAERVSGELGQIMFWVHHASGPIAIGILTVSASVALIGYLASAVLW